MAIWKLICISGMVIYQVISGLKWPFQIWYAYLDWLSIKLHLAWYSHIKLDIYFWYFFIKLYESLYGLMKIDMYIWHGYLSSYIWLDMAIWKLICISGMIIYQVISGMIWPYKTWYVFLAFLSSSYIRLYMAIWKLICISGMVIYQIISGLIWQFQTLFNISRYLYLVLYLA